MHSFSLLFVQGIIILSTFVAKYNYIDNFNSNSTMKKTFFKSILFAGMLLGTMASCSDVEDLYNPELVREKAKKALGLDIAADQDWNMTSVVTANFTLTEDALSDYSFRIYSANPTTNSNAVILANYDITTDANGKASASFKFEMPSYLDYVYVARVDDHGRRMIGIANIENGAISKAFGENVSASTKAITDYELPTMDAPYTEDEVNSLIATSTEINDIELYNNTIRIIGNVVVNSSVNGTIDFNGYYYHGASNPTEGSNKLIIANGATVEISNCQLSGMDIIVAEGGTLKINGLIKMQDYVRIIVMQGGNVVNEYDPAAEDNSNTVNLNFSDGSVLIYNAGTMNVGLINASNGGKLYNASTGVLKAKTINLSNANDEIYNWGKIEAGRIVGNYGNGEGQGILHNGCLIRCDEIKVLQLNLSANSAFEVDYVSANAYYLREYSIVRATTIAANGYANYYVGEEGGKALMSSENLSSTYFVHADANIYVETTNIYQGGTNYSEWWNGELRSKVNICPIGEAPLVISAEKAKEIENADCIGDGNTPKDEVIEELLGSTFTYAFEDLNKEVGDYDMNDVVLKCNGPKDGKITIRLVAAGAMKNLYVYFYNAQTNVRTPLFEGKEVHEAFGVEEGSIVNTGISSSATIVEETISVNDGFLFTTHGDIYIMDEEGRESHIPNFDTTFKPGDAPYGICVPCNWRYPKEYVSIITAYPNFVDWAGDVTVQDWYTLDKADTNSIY